MRRILLTLVLTLGATASLSATEVGLSTSLSPSPLYNWQWEPGLDGGSLAASLRIGGPSLTIATGIEAGISGLGTQLLLPVALEHTLVAWGHQRLTAGAGALLGIALFHPAPLFVLGDEATASWSWFWNERWGLQAGLGIRYLTSPGYARRVAPYQVVDLPVTVGLRYRLAPPSEHHRKGR